MKRKFVNRIDRESVRPVVGRPGALRMPVEGVLSDGHFSANGRIEGIRGRVNERAPGVVRSGSKAALKSAIDAELHRMVDRRRSVGAEAEHTGAGIEPGTAQNGESARSRVVYAVGVYWCRFLKRTSFGVEGESTGNALTI